MDDSGPIDVVVSHIVARKNFGEDQNGAQLERHFGSAPFGAPVESIQAVLAAAMRAGMIEVVSQAAKITSSTDHRLEQVFGTIPKFRAASFRPAQDSGPTIEVRGEVSEWLATETGDKHSLDLQELATAGRTAFRDLREPCTEARSRLQGAGLPVPESLTTMTELLERVSSTDDEVVVTTLHERAADLSEGKKAVSDLAELVDVELELLRAARKAIESGRFLNSSQGEDWSDDLSELLGRARYREDLAEIKSITTAIENANESAESGLMSSISDEVDAAVAKLRSTYPTVDDSEFERATEPISQLKTMAGLGVMRSNLAAVEGKTLQAADGLATLSTTKKVLHIRASDVWSGPITTADELDAALVRLREAVAEKLGENTEVRFR